MENDKQKILDMINTGTITAEDGARLLECLGDAQKEERIQAKERAGRMKGRKLRVQVNGTDKGSKQNVNVSIPLALARYADGIIAKCVPENVSENMKSQGFDLKGLNIGEIVDVFEDLEEDIVNVDIQEEDKGTDLKVRVYVE